MNDSLNTKSQLDKLRELVLSADSSELAGKHFLDLLKSNDLKSLSHEVDPNCPVARTLRSILAAQPRFSHADAYEGHRGMPLERIPFGSTSVRRLHLHRIPNSDFYHGAAIVRKFPAVIIFYKDHHCGLVILFSRNLSEAKAAHFHIDPNAPLSPGLN